MIVVDILDEFINEYVDYTLVLTNPILVNIDNIEYTKFNTTSLLYARPELNIIYNNTEYEIYSVDYNNNELTIIGNLADLDISTYIVTLQKPLYIHGTHYAVNQEFNSMSRNREMKYPIVYFLEIVRESIPSDIDSSISTIADIRLFFLDRADFKNWNTNDIYKNVIELQRVYLDHVLNTMNVSFSLFNRPNNIEIYTFPKFGEYLTNKGVVNKLFDENLSGVELSLTLPIKKIICER